MRYQNEVIIKASRDKVIELFDNPDNLAKWQKGFVSMELIEGDPREVGAKHKMRYKMGKRDVEMIETVTKKDLPNIFSGSYEAKGVYNHIDNYFEVVDENTTKYRSENEFRLKGMMKLMGLIMPGAFKKQTQQYMNDFRDFVEKEVREG